LCDEKQAFSTIKKLEISYEAVSRTHGLVEDTVFAIECSNSHSITITIPFEEMLSERVDDRWNIYESQLSCSEIVSKSNLTSLFMCTALQYLTLNIRGLWIAVLEEEPNDIMTDELAEHIEKAFKEEHVKVLNIHMVCTGMCGYLVKLPIGKPSGRTPQLVVEH
jgi:hypothetical protein